METLLSKVIWGNTVMQWLIAIGISLVSYLVLYITIRVVSRRLRGAAKGSKAEVVDLLADLTRQTKPFFILIVALSIGSLSLDLSEEGQKWLGTIAIAALFIQIGLWGIEFVEFVIARGLKDRGEMDPDTVTVQRMLSIFTKIAVWAVVLLLILDNIPGISATSLIASLGIAGIAVGLALQNILGDLFSSASIVLDRPFVIGDFIIVGDMLGTVEHIGLKSTRMRSLSGELLVFSNSDLLNSRIRNFKVMYERRIVSTVGVTYETPNEKLPLISKIIQEAIEREEQVRFDRANFAAFGDFSLNFEYVYFVLSPDFRIYMDIQERINQEIHQRFAVEGIIFAYPTQRLFIEKPAA